MKPANNPTDRLAEIIRSLKMLEKEYDLIKQIGQTIPTSLSITDIDDVSMYANSDLNPSRTNNSTIGWSILTSLKLKNNCLKTIVEGSKKRS